MNNLVSINDVIKQLNAKSYVNAQLKDSIKYHMTQLEKLKNEIIEFENDYFESEFKLRQLECKNNEYKNKIDQLEKENIMYKKNIDQLEFINTNYQSIINKLENNTKKWNNEINKILSQNKKRKFDEI